MKLNRCKTNIFRDSRVFQKLRIQMFLMALMVIFISGCGASENKVIDNNWQNEILIMDDCGSDGLKCCIDQDPSCSFGQTCCINPNNSDENYCSDECSFGGLNQYCQSGNICDGSLVCMNGSCVECGVEGNSCCMVGNKCVEQDSLNKNRTECVNNICKACGHGGNVICHGEIDCIMGNFQNNDICLSCGNFNQPCCRGDGLDKCLGNDLVCELGFCVI